MKEPATFRAFSPKKIFNSSPPGPMAQASTFRAFGAETQSFHRAAYGGGSDKYLLSRPPWYHEAFQQYYLDT
jgi:hypothetical protein